MEQQSDLFAESETLAVTGGLESSERAGGSKTTSRSGSESSILRWCDSDSGGRNATGSSVCVTKSSSTSGGGIKDWKVVEIQF